MHDTCPCVLNDLLKAANLGRDTASAAILPNSLSLLKRDTVASMSSGTAHAAFVIKKDAAIAAFQSRTGTEGSAAANNRTATDAAGGAIEVPRVNKEHDVEHVAIKKVSVARSGLLRFRHHQRRG